MSHTIERERIRKERFGYPNYAVPSFWWASGVSGISKTIRQPSYFYAAKEEFITLIKETHITIEKRDFKVQLPNSFKVIANEIEESKHLLDLEEDWDGEGGMQITFETWKKAISFIVDYAMWLYDKHQHFVIEPPQINPGPDTSIDLLWRNEKYRLLVNIPENSEQPVEYYGDNNHGENSIKGKLKTGSVQEFFALWLKNMKR